jgi:hypothetical protein
VPAVVRSRGPHFFLSLIHSVQCSLFFFFFVMTIFFFLS